jgi:hypothetical protein
VSMVWFGLGDDTSFFWKIEPSYFRKKVFNRFFLKKLSVGFVGMENHAYCSTGFLKIFLVSPSFSLSAWPICWLYGDDSCTEKIIDGSLQLLVSAQIKTVERAHFSAHS